MSTRPSVRPFLRFLTGRRTLLISAPFSRGVMSVVLTSLPHRAWSRFNFQLSFAHPPALDSRCRRPRCPRGDRRPGAVVPETATFLACPGVVNEPSSRTAPASETSRIPRPKTSAATYTREVDHAKSPDRVGELVGSKADRRRRVRNVEDVQCVQVRDVDAPVMRRDERGAGQESCPRARTADSEPLPARGVQRGSGPDRAVWGR